MSAMYWKILVIGRWILIKTVHAALTLHKRRKNVKIPFSDLSNLTLFALSLQSLLFINGAYHQTIIVLQSLLFE